VELRQEKHPPSLGIFFATEMWERYGFYVVQTLLALYLAFYFKWQDSRVYSLVGTFTALTYLSPVIGGWIADNLLGQKKAIITGAIALFFSYLSLFLFTSDTALVAALAGVAVGTGLLKPNISSLLGNEYPENSLARENGFTIFYMGITTGIILGTTLPSQLHYYFGWTGAFVSAAIGMIIALAIFAFGVHRYKIADYHPSEISVTKATKALLMTFSLWAVSFFLLNYPALANIAFGLVILLCFIYLIDLVKRENHKQARQTLVIGLLCIISVMFWAFYFQMFLSLTLFISRVVEPKLFGILFPPPYYVSIQSIGMILFGYFISRKMGQLDSTHSGIKTGNKFILAMIFMTMAYTLITLVCHSSHGTGLLSPLYFIPAYALISIAELLLSPVGLAAITVLASRKKVSTMMGIFFVSLGIGAFLSGKIATLTAVNPEELSILQLKAHYTHTFTYLFLILLIATFISLILNRIIKYLLRSHSQEILN
jgi:POT family proton-dependent oligopeptide transporter